MMTAPRAMRAFCQTWAKSLPQASMAAQGAAGLSAWGASPAARASRMAWVSS